MAYVLAYDIGTTGVKTCLFAIGERIRLVAGVSRGYGLYILENGGAGQDAAGWGGGLCAATKETFSKKGVSSGGGGGGFSPAGGFWTKNRYVGPPRPGGGVGLGPASGGAFSRR